MLSPKKNSTKNCFSQSRWKKKKRKNLNFVLIAMWPNPRKCELWSVQQNDSEKAAATHTHAGVW